ncbi:MAG: UDP-N-acetylmuramoyl-L-alanyl-D-glutamate--2,6-diaminopimelate ligase [Candidatus Nanopelagicales bacterium]
MAPQLSDAELNPQAKQLPLAGLGQLLDLKVEFGEEWIRGVTHDSRRVQAGNLYAALPGANFHGAQFVVEAVANGAHAVLTDEHGQELINQLASENEQVVGVPTLVVDDPRAALGPVAAWVYDYPARALQMIGITGTDGKTTTAMLIEGALNSLGVLTGLVGTIATRVGDWSAASARTTPEASDLQALLAFMRDQGAKAAVLEVSSHALELGRADSIVFDLAVFTNLGLDHLDFHGTQENYFAAKSKLFSIERAKRAVICADDQWGVKLLEQVTIPAEAYVVEGLQETKWSRENAPTWTANDLSLTPNGLKFKLYDPEEEIDVASPFLAGTGLFGRYNVANATAAIAVTSWVLANLEDVSFVDPTTVYVATKAVSSSQGAPGRMESVDAGQDFTMLVDYAHTPDAVASALGSVGELAAATGGRVICVLGCGGDRDPSKRPTMGQLAVQLADIAIITDDNPRSEDPADIRSQIMDGIEALSQNYRATIVEEIGDRRAAIAHAVSLAQTGDVVVALGKGHEQGQEVNGEILPMDDRELLAKSAKTGD